VRSLLDAERVRFGRRPDIRLLVALIPVILAVLYVNAFNSVTTQPQQDFFFDPPDPVAEAELRAQQLAEWRAGLAAQLPSFAFPASLLKVTGNFLPVILLAIYFATALVAGEFEWGTVRTVHLTSSRVAAMAVRILFVVLLVAIAVAIALLLVSVLPFLLSFEGRPLQVFAAPVADLATTLASQLVTVLPFISIPVLLSVLARSSSIAFLLTLLLFFADLAIAGAPIWAGSGVPWVPALTISGSVGRVLGGENTQFASLVPVGVSLAAVLVWAVLPVVAAVAWFRRADLNE
jgi:hypothetical protein